MDIEQFVDKTDILLYKKILSMIVKDWDTMDSDRLGQLLDKLRELHTSLDKVILQRQQQSLFDKDYYTSQFDRKNVKEFLTPTTISLKDINIEIKNKKKKARLGQGEFIERHLPEEPQPEQQRDNPE